MEENYQYHQQQQKPPTRLRNSGGGGEIVEVQGGHIVRSTGRKDRHSKVCTAKGPRDRRVRLSAHTAIQFYDVQDRLGYDRPSKAVDWLIKKAKTAIDELAELPAWKPTNSTTNPNFDQNPNSTNFEQHPDDNIADNQMGNNQNSTFLPQSLDTIKSFFPIPPTNSTAPQFHHNFPQSELIPRTNHQNQDLKLSLQSFQDPIIQQPPQHHQGNNIFYDWPETQPGGYQRLVACGGGDTVFGSQPPQTPVFLQPLLFGQPTTTTTNNQLFNYISQRGPLQSSNTPPIRAWVDPPQPFSGHDQLAFHHPLSMAGFNSGGFSGQLHIPPRIQGEDEEPSSASSDSRDCD